MEKQRLVWLDALKGIGMLLIVLSHSELDVPGKNYLVSGFIPLFFIATGYTFSFRDSIKQIALKRSKRLLIPYFVYGIMIVVLFTFAGIDGGASS